MSGAPDPLFAADLGELRNVEPKDLLLRFAFGAAISVIAGLAGQFLGHLVGGMLLAFPAIAPATLTLVESKDGNRAAVHDVGGAVFGGFGLIAFAVAGVLLFGHISAPLTLLVCLAAWTAVAIAFYVLRAEELIPLPEPVRGRHPIIDAVEDKAR